jgi:hypothetical protein
VQVMMNPMMVRLTTVSSHQLHTDLLLSMEAER